MTKDIVVSNRFVTDRFYFFTQTSERERAIARIQIQFLNHGLIVPYHDDIISLPPAQIFDSRIFESLKGVNIVPQNRMYVLTVVVKLHSAAK